VANVFIAALFKQKFSLFVDLENPISAHLSWAKMCGQFSLADFLAGYDQY
jgi:hypothetical protein